MRKFNEHPQVDDSILQKISEIHKVGKINNPTQSVIWDKAQYSCVKEFKKIVLEKGLKIQESRCSWCTLLIGEKGRRTPQRDHIAPKSTYPKWTFLTKNIVLSCEYCNGFAIKNKLDTVEEDAADYDDVKFFVVHPYKDEPKCHIEFEGGSRESGITIRGKTLKGSWTIANLKLDSPGMTELRARDFLYFQTSDSLPEPYKSLFDKATGRGGSS